MISRENNKNNLFRVKSKNGVLRCLKAGMDINMCNSKGQTEPPRVSWRVFYL